MLGAPSTFNNATSNFWIASSALSICRTKLACRILANRGRDSILSVQSASSANRRQLLASVPYRRLVPEVYATSAHRWLSLLKTRVGRIDGAVRQESDAQ